MSGHRLRCVTTMRSPLAPAFPVGSCPHVAVLLSHHDEVPAALASFYALGAKRNGWLYHRSLGARVGAARPPLTAAGLDVAALEAAGRLVFSEMEPDISVEDYVLSWEDEMQAALGRGFEAVWCARFPVGPSPDMVARSVEYAPAGAAPAHARRYVSLCIYIVGAVEHD